MTYDIFIALAAFSLVSSITPGPNNLMLMASGANFGFRRTIPHMLGVNLGFTFMVLLLGVGLVQAFEAYPVSYRVLQVVSVAYLLYLAWKIATAAPAHADAAQTGKPFSFVQAAAFQWVNPKAWTMALTAVSVYSPSQSISSVGLIAAIFGLINLPCINLWTTLGLELQRVLTNPARLRTFNIAMAVLLVGSLYPLFL